MTPLQTVLSCILSVCHKTIFSNRSKHSDTAIITNKKGNNSAPFKFLLQLHTHCFYHWSDGMFDANTQTLTQSLACKLAACQWCTCPFTANQSPLSTQVCSSHCCTQGIRAPGLCDVRSHKIDTQKTWPVRMPNNTEIFSKANRTVCLIHPTKCFSQVCMSNL